MRDWGEKSDWREYRLREKNQTGEKTAWGTKTRPGCTPQGSKGGLKSIRGVNLSEVKLSLRCVEA
jgi:hypothetical protein